MEKINFWEVDDPWFDGLYDPFGNKLYRFSPPLFEISVNPSIPLTTIPEKRFNLIERAQNIARSEYENRFWQTDDPFSDFETISVPMTLLGTNKNGDNFGRLCNR